MNIWRQVLVIFLIFCIAFWSMRGFISGLKVYQLNNSAYKKRKKGETIKEWFLYSRYKDIIPKTLYILYYVLIIIHFLILIVCIIFHFLSLEKWGEIISIVTVVVDCLWILILRLLFWRSSPGYAYSRWIKKRRGQPPNKDE